MHKKTKIKYFVADLRKKFLNKVKRCIFKVAFFVNKKVNNLNGIQIINIKIHITPHLIKSNIKLYKLRNVNLTFLHQKT